MRLGRERPAGGRRLGPLRRLTGYFDIRAGEGPLAGLLCLAAFAVISAHYFLKPVAKSLFMGEHGSRGLPDVYLSVALVTAVVGTAYGALARRLPVGWLLNLVLAALAAAVLVFRAWLAMPGATGGSGVSGLLGASSASHLFYVFASTYGVLGPALLWFVVNQALEPRQARRLIGLVGAGSIAGAIVAGYLVHFIIDEVGTLNLLVGAAVFIALALACLNLAIRHGSPVARRPPRRHSGAGIWRLVTGHRYVRLLTGLIAIVMVVATLSEYLFLWAVEQHVPPGAPTAAFIATWYSTVNVICLPLQLLVSAPLLRRWGVGPALLVLPVSLTLVAGGMALWPVLALGVSMKVGESALRYSVNKSAVEMLYLPLPGWIKDRIKVFVDTVVDRLAKGAAGLLLKGLLVAGAGVQGVALVTAGLCAAWAVGSFVIRRRYVEAFRDALDRGAVDLKTERIRLDETGALTAVGLRLNGQPAAVRQALDVLVDGEGLGTGRLHDQLVALAADADPGIASRALRLLAREPGAAALEAARRRLDDPAPAVATAASEVLVAASPDPAAFLRERAEKGLLARTHAMAALLSCGEDVPDELVEELLVDDTPSGLVARRQLAEALSDGKLPHRRQLLRRLMADPEAEVAAEAIRGAGALRDPTLLPFLVAELRRPAHRAPARAALAAMGQAVLVDLERWFWDERIEMDVRKRLARAIEETAGAASRDVLVRGLSIPDPHLRHQVLKSLNRLTRETPFRVPDGTRRALLLRECRYLCELISLDAVAGGTAAAPGPCRRLYQRTLQNAIRAARQRLFRVLGLRGQGRHWANAFAGLVSGNPRLKASAIEFADGTLPDKLRRFVVPLIDDVDPDVAVRRVGPTLGVGAKSAQEALLIAAEGPDGWLASCALHVAGEESVVAAAPVAAARLRDGNIWVRDAAAAAERTLGGLAAMVELAEPVPRDPGMS